MQTTLIGVGGMTCGGCVKSVTNVLVALDGVAKAEVSLERGVAEVTFDSIKISREALLRAIDEAGFEAT